MDQKLKILHLIDTTILGGAEKLLFNSLNDLEKYFDNHLLIISKTEGRIKIQNIKPNDFKVSYLNTKVSLSHSIRIIIQIRRIIKKNKFNVCHTHLYWSTIFTRIASIGLNVKIITTIHNNQFDKSHPYYSFKHNLIEKITSNLSSYFIFISKNVKLTYENYISKSAKGEIVYNYIDSIYFGKKFSPKSVNKLIFVGNYKKEKNIELLIKVSKELKKMKPDLYLTVVGRGYKNLNITEPNIIFKNETNKIHEELIQNNVFLTLSMNEGFGIALAEAMAIGLYCIASYNSGHIEVGGDSINYIDLNKSPDLIAENIEKLLSSKGFKNSNIASKKRAKLFKKEKYIASLNKIYYSVLNDD